MRLVYIDESGISVNEPILVVAGVVIDADSQWRLVDPPQLPRRFMHKGVRIEAGNNHSLAFSLCAMAVESFMRNHARPDEVATLYAENNTDTREAVKRAHNILRGKSLKDPGELDIFELLSEVTPGHLPLSRVIDGVSFTEKHEASLLQVADACALIIRYSLQKRTDAEGLINLFSQGQPEKLIPEGAAEESMTGYNVLMFSPPPGTAQ
jgi:hypothetical protein